MGRTSENLPDLVTIATTASVIEAKILVLTLEAEGIKAFIPDENTSTTLSHVTLAINPNGIQVLVSPEDAQAAREALDAARSRAPSDGMSKAKAPEDSSEARCCADKAAWSALFAWLLPPAAFFTLYWLVRARKAAASDPPKDGKRFRQDLWAAAWLGVGLGASMGMFWLLFLAHRIF